jgi:hypothetical protein
MLWKVREFHLHFLSFTPCGKRTMSNRHPFTAFSVQMRTVSCPYPSISRILRPQVSRVYACAVTRALEDVDAERHQLSGVLFSRIPGTEYLIEKLPCLCRSLLYKTRDDGIPRVVYLHCQAAGHDRTRKHNLSTSTQSSTTDAISAGYYHCS